MDWICFWAKAFIQGRAIIDPAKARGNAAF
jgi:hypothetical protein